LITSSILDNPGSPLSLWMSENICRHPVSYREFCRCRYPCAGVFSERDIDRLRLPSRGEWENQEPGTLRRQSAKPIVGYPTGPPPPTDAHLPRSPEGCRRTPDSICHIVGIGTRRGAGGGYLLSRVSSAASAVVIHSVGLELGVISSVSCRFPYHSYRFCTPHRAITLAVFSPPAQSIKGSLQEIIMNEVQQESGYPYFSPSLCVLRILHPEF
jgi:hypothetical protein